MILDPISPPARALGSSPSTLAPTPASTAPGRASAAGGAGKKEPASADEKKAKQSRATTSDPEGGATDPKAARLPTVHLVAGARPNFMKVAPLFRVLADQDWCEPLLVHTGQHYDRNMSQQFLDELGLPTPAHSLGVGSGSHAEQTAAVLVAYERICRDEPPDWIVVVGDVNSTLAAALVGAKLGIPVAHLEAGLRSGDRSMPEEINRVLTDQLSDLLWTPSSDADVNLRAEGIPRERIERVGNIMLDSYEMLRPRIEASTIRSDLDLPDAYGVVTLHRPFNVDDEKTLGVLVEQLASLARTLPLVFPVHPRTRERLAAFSLEDRLAGAAGVRLLEPVGYIEFMALVRAARLAITDSGGLQEETTYLRIPCLTVRPSTERPITIEQGTNRLTNASSLAAEARRILVGDAPEARRPDLWDGATAGRVAASLSRALRVRAEDEGPPAGERAGRSGTGATTP